MASDKNKTATASPSTNTPSVAKTLFQAYSLVNSEYMKAMADAAIANEKRSNVVKSIKEELGVGPFEMTDGSVVKVMTRKETIENEKGEKEPTGKETYYFRCIVIGGTIQKVG